MTCFDSKTSARCYSDNGMAESRVALIRRIRRKSVQSRVKRERHRKRPGQDQGRVKARRDLEIEFQMLPASGDGGDEAAVKRTMDMIWEYKAVTNPHDKTTEEFNRELQVVAGLVNFRLLCDEDAKQLRHGF